MEKMLEINRIYCMDCIDGMKGIDDESIDLIFTDPPYGINKKKIAGDENIEVYKSSLDDSFRILKNNSFYMTFCGAGQIKKFVCINPFTYRWMSLLYINNGMVRGNIGFSAYIVVLIFTKGKAVIKKRIRDVMEISTSSKELSARVHPYQKYLPYVRELIEATTNKNDIVFDPFIGSGTVAIACTQLNRKFIGFDINSDVVDKANMRLQKANIKRFW